MGKALLPLSVTTVIVTVTQLLLLLLLLNHNLLLFSLNYTTSTANCQPGREQTIAKLAPRGETSRRRRCKCIPGILSASLQTNADSS
jgi:hypothetical protein